MKRADNYRGKRRRTGLDAAQAAVVAVLMLVLITAMTVKASSAWTGMSAGEQLQQALFVATDLD